MVLRCVVRRIFFVIGTSCVSGSYLLVDLVQGGWTERSVRSESLSPVHPREGFSVHDRRRRGGHCGRRVLVGKPAFLRENGVGDIAALETIAAPHQAEGPTAIFVGIDGHAAGVLTVADPVKSTTAFQSRREPSLLFSTTPVPLRDRCAQSNARRVLFGTRLLPSLTRTLQSRLCSWLSLVTWCLSLFEEGMIHRYSARHFL